MQFLCVVREVRSSMIALFCTIAIGVLVAAGGSLAYEREACTNGYDGMFVMFVDRQTPLVDVQSGKAFGDDSRFRVLRAFENYLPDGTRRFLVQFAYTGTPCNYLVDEVKNMPGVVDAKPNTLYGR